MRICVLLLKHETWYMALVLYELILCEFDSL